MLCLFAGYIVALQLRDEQWLAAGGHSIIYIALPIFIMFEIAREAQDVETLANRLTAIQRSLGALGATAIRSEARRVGQECVSSFSTRRSAYHYTQYKSTYNRHRTQIPK